MLRERAAQARRRAAVSGNAAVRLEESAALMAPSLRHACARMAELQRRAQAHQLTSAKLQEQFADQLGGWLRWRNELKRKPLFIDAVAEAIGARSAAVIMFGTQRDEAVVAASDATARAAYDLEFILGEGPAHSAVAGGQTVQAAGRGLRERWPQYGPQVAGLGIRALIAVPLQFPALGVLCAYGSEPVISEQEALAAGAVAGIPPLTFWPSAPDGQPGDGFPPLPSFGDTAFPAVVHQAAGMVSQQCGCGITDAIALIRARAFAIGGTTEEIAAAVLAGERLC